MKNINDIEEIENLSGQDGVTFSGGDPMFQAKECSILAKKVHELGMNVWTYTGFTYEELINKGSKDILGIWIGENESTKYWLSFLNELDSKNKKIFIDDYFDSLKHLKSCN